MPAIITAIDARDTPSLGNRSHIGRVLISDQWANTAFTVGATATDVRCSINNTSATFPTPPGGGAYNVFTVSKSDMILPCGMARFSLSATTTAYLIMQCTFASSTCSAFGFLGARRVG